MATMACLGTTIGATSGENEATETYRYESYRYSGTVRLLAGMSNASLRTSTPVRVRVAVRGTLGTWTPLGGGAVVGSLGTSTLGCVGVAAVGSLGTWIPDPPITEKAELDPPAPGLLPPVLPSARLVR